MDEDSLLVADEDQRSLRLLEGAFRQAGFGVGTARDGAEALQRIRVRPPELILSEVRLPTLDGVALCRAVRAQRRTAFLPFLLMSGDQSPAVRERALEAGADEFFEKPLRVDDVIVRVRRLLKRTERREPTGAALVGAIGDLGLVDLFQSLETWKKTAIVVCEGEGRRGQVWVKDGQVIDAETGPLEGEAAFYRLFGWESGTFHVQFRPVERRPRIGSGTQHLLLEGMRRKDEIARIVQNLPLGAVLAIDGPALARMLAEVPDEMNGILRHFDGRRTLREVVDESPLDDLDTIEALPWLLSRGILRQAGAPPPPQAARKALEIVRFPAVRGVWRERLRREEEAARAAIAAGRPLRLTRIVELPATAPDGSDALRHGERLLSPVSSEAARQLAAEAPMARLRRWGEKRPGEHRGHGPGQEPPSGGRARTANPNTTPTPNTTATPNTTPTATPNTTPTATATPTPTARSTSQPNTTATVNLNPTTTATPTARSTSKPNTTATVNLNPTAAGMPTTTDPPPPRPAGELRFALGRKARRWIWFPLGAAAALGSFLAVRDYSDREVDVASAGPGRAPEPRPDASESVRSLAEGEALLRRGRYRDAVDELTRAVALAPDSVPALLALGAALLEAGEPKRALLPLERAAQLDSRNSRAHLLLATALQGLDRAQEAAQAYRRYLELAPAGDREAQSRFADLHP